MDGERHSEGTDGPAAGELVLVVDDDVNARTLVEGIVAREGFSVVGASGVAAAEDVLRASDVIIALLDLTLRDGNGLDLVKRLSLDPLVGTIILSARADDTDRIIGLEVGADDYLAKPFHPRELAVRLRRHATRLRTIRELTRSRDDKRANIGPWSIDEQRRAVFHESGGRAVVSDAEFRTLLCLFHGRGRVLSRDTLYREVVGPGLRDPLDRRIDVYVSGLRKKLALTKPNAIRTVHGVGYILD